MAQIGTVGVSQRLEAQPTPKVDSRRFGAGVAEALSGLAQATDRYAQSVSATGDSQAGLEAQYAERQRRLARANAEVGLIRMNNELDREVVTLGDSAARDGAGFTDAVKDLTDKRTAAFLATLPAELRPEYEGRIEGVRQASINTGFQQQILLEDTAYKTDLTDLAQQAIDSIKSGRGTYEEWGHQLSAMRANSPLGELETEQLFATLEDAIKLADMQTAAAAIALNPAQGSGTTGGPADGSDVVAAGLPGVARGLLNTIAGVESGNDYGIITSGGGRVTDFSDHPRKYVELPNGSRSSAAGRYQIIASTWDRAAAALGLPDFSPESQDRAAWWIAQEDYKAKSGGRDLVTDMNSGNFALVAGVRRVLGGTGNSTTWQAFQNMTDEEFFQKISGQEGTPSALMNDPRYADLPFDTRMAVISDAEGLAAQLRADAAAKELAARNAAMSNLQMQIESGGAGMTDILAFSEKNQLTFEEHKKLIDQFSAKNEQLMSAANYVAAVNAPGFDPNSAENKKGADALYARAGQTAIAAGDETYVNSAFVPLAQRSGYIPPQAEQQLAAMLQSSDPKSFAFAQQTLGTLAQSAPQAFAKLDAATRNDVVFAQRASAYMTPAEIQASLRQRHDPQSAALIDQRRDEAAKLLAPTNDTTRAMNVAAITEELGADFPVTDKLGSQVLEQDFAMLFAENYAKYPDEALAREAALEQLKQVWGPTELSGDAALMRYPPEQMYPPFEGSMDYLRETLVQDFALPEGAKFQIVSDPRTEAEVRSGKPPSYIVMLQDSDGVFYPAQAPSGEENAAGRARPARISFPITEQMQLKAIDKVVVEREVYQLEKDAAMLETELSLNPPADPAEKKRLQETLTGIQVEIDGLRTPESRPTNRMLNDEAAAKMYGRAVAPRDAGNFIASRDQVRQMEEIDNKLKLLQTKEMPDADRARLKAKYEKERADLLEAVRNKQ